MDRKRAVLFGAGLSANWGGLLAKDVGSLLHSYMRNFHCKDKDYLLTDRTYEDGWDHILAVNEEQFINLKRALEDNLVRVFEFQHPLLLAKTGSAVLDHIGRFLKDILLYPRNLNALVLTTNQDTLLDEVRTDGFALRTPNIDAVRYQDEARLRKRDMPKLFTSAAPNPHTIMLLKLHGSYDWVYDLRPVMITGSSKRPELLPPYLATCLVWLDEWLTETSLDLVIIGHSMQDKYLIDLLSKHCNERWRVFIIDAMNPHEWFKDKSHFKTSALMERLECFLPQKFGSLLGPNTRNEPGYLAYTSEIRNPIVGV